MKKSHFVFGFAILIYCIQCAYRDNSNDPMSPNYSRNSLSNLRIDSIGIWQNAVVDSMAIQANYFDTASFFIYIHDTSSAIAKYIWNFDGNRIETTYVNFNYQVYSDTGRHWIRATIIDAFSNNASLSDTFFVPLPVFFKAPTQNP